MGIEFKLENRKVLRLEYVDISTRTLLQYFW